MYDYIMQRTQISLRDDQRAALDEVAARTGRSVASLIRDLIDAEFELARSRDDDLAALHASAGAWAADHRGDGAAYVERLRTGRRLDAVRSS